MKPIDYPALQPYFIRAKTFLSHHLRGRKRKVYAAAAGLFLIWFAFCLPRPLFQEGLSTVMVSDEGKLLGARIASDGQWRFPESDTLPVKFEKAMVAFEDKRFYSHWGVDPWAMSRAFYLNLKHLKVVSGGSTLTMQTIRMARKGQSRTFLEKFIEIFCAFRLEIKYPKKKILNLYASHAPFGGNVVGLDAASWKYFGRDAGKLSWAESAMLAVLPNSPALIHPGRNRQALKKKRDALLEKLWRKGEMDSLACLLSQGEPLPDKPLPLPQLAPHLLDRVAKNFGGQEHEKAVIFTTIDIKIQRQLNNITARRHQALKENEINNLCILVADVETGAVLGYVGNVDCGHENSEKGCSVDVITSPRSTGSILKPFLYASMLADGKILPTMIVPDVPSYYGDYKPRNYDLNYSGALPAKKALARSLNVPAVAMLSDYGVPRFRQKLQSLGMTTLFRPARDYGLTLVLGGAEATLWDLASIYASMGRTLESYFYFNGKYPQDSFRPLHFYKNQTRYFNETDKDKLTSNAPLSAPVIWETFQSMVEVSRPSEEGYWERYSSSSKIAWKTGTSFGFRDAWAIGVTPKYVVAVWVGNADGEGRPGINGITAAAPVLFDVFETLEQKNQWFKQPYDLMEQVDICAQSGFLAGQHCGKPDSLWIPKDALNVAVCPYHKVFHLDASGQWQVHADCEPPANMTHRSYFVLPPVLEAHYKNKNPDYEIPPAFRKDCERGMPKLGNQQMEIVYPKFDTKIYVPKNLDETRSSVVFEVAHRKPGMVVFWHLDETYMGQTKHFHEMSFNPSPGRHKLVLVDAAGNRVEQVFEILP